MREIGARDSAQQHNLNGFSSAANGVLQRSCAIILAKGSGLLPQNAFWQASANLPAAGFRVHTPIIMVISASSVP